MNLNIVPVLCNQLNMANYAYIVYDRQTCVIIDAPESYALKNKLNTLNLTPTHLLITHHHFDHIEGISALKEEYNLKVIAPQDEFDSIPQSDIKAEYNKTLTINTLTFDVIKASGHTLGHALYYQKENHALFTGDVLFNLCVGGLFEGTAQQMYESLQKIKSLPDNTNIFPGHEYTRACLPAQLSSSTTFENYLKKMYARETGKLAPATLQEEKMFNPYLKADTLSEFLGQE